MNVELCHASQIKQKISEFNSSNSSFGSFILCIPNRNSPVNELESLCKAGSKTQSKYPIVIGAPKNGESVKELSRELLGMEYVRKNRPEHEGDPIARREIDARLSSIRSLLENELREAFINANWYLNGRQLLNPGKLGISSMASDFNLATTLS